MRAVDAWAIEEQGVPAHDLMERAGARAGAGDGGRGARDGPIRIVVGKGNNGGDGLRGRAAAARGRPRGRRPGGRRPRRATGDAATTSTPPGRRAEPFAPSGSTGPARSSTRCSAPASRARRASRSPSAIAAINAPGRARGGLRRALGRERHRPARSRARRSRRAATATFHGSKVGLHVEPGQGARRRGRGRSRSASRAARPAGGGRADLRARARPLSAPAARAGSKFDSGVVVVVGRVRAGSPARPRWPRGRPRAPGAGYVQVAVPEPVQQAVDLRLLEQMSRGLPGRRRLPHPAGRRGRGGDGRARRRGGARPGLGRDRGRAGVRARRGARRWRRRCWWTPTA